MQSVPAKSHSPNKAGKAKFEGPKSGAKGPISSGTLQKRRPENQKESKKKGPRESTFRIGDIPGTDKLINFRKKLMKKQQENNMWNVHGN